LAGSADALRKDWLVVVGKNVGRNCAGAWSGFGHDQPFPFIASAGHRVTHGFAGRVGKAGREST